MNVAIIGYGKMGREIEKILLERNHRVGLIIDIDNRADLCAEKLGGIDVAIEFSTPGTAYDNVVGAINCGVPVVCGTTAWLDRLAEAEALCRAKGGAFFYASNYSVGVNILFKINEKLAELMNRHTSYDVTIEETHHTAKKDAPSGTAITLAEGIIKNLNRKSKWFDGPTTKPEELGITAVRRSVVPGTHTVTYESEIDTLTVTHCAKGRRGFAFGAVLAAEFIAGKRGVFTMDDLLGV